jgi:heterodisulfide reductase subunit D
MDKKKKESFKNILTKLQLEELEACTRCGICLNFCPTYDVLKDISFTTPVKIRDYKSFIKAVHGLKAMVLGPGPIDKETLQHFAEGLYHCTTCGMCGEVCQAGIITQSLWPALRAKMVELGIGPMGPQKELPGIVEEKHNPYGEPHEKRFEWLPDDIKVADKAEIGYYVGCSGAYVAQPMVEGALRVLNAAGVEFTLLNPEEHCCGFPLFIVGYRDELKELAKHNIEAFVKKGIKRLIVSCPCCTNMITKYWPGIYGRPLPFEVVHIFQVVSELIDEGKLNIRKALDETITYHDPCYLSRGIGLTEEPRKLIKLFPKAKFVEMKRNKELSKCCGAGGGIRRAYPDMSFDMAINLIKDAEKTGASILAISCPACYERLHLAIRERNYKTNLKIMDLMQITASLL